MDPNPTRLVSLSEEDITPRGTQRTGQGGREKAFTHKPRKGLQRNQLCQHLDLRPLASRTGRHRFVV